MTSLVFVMLSPYDQVLSLLAFALLLVLYAVAYRRAALLLSRRVLRIPRRRSGMSPRQS